mmetsp:Transcript_8205/g.13302  ORF Transcript_8205/g.13302 Transcript_8205/m.13302 type:complete len:384 (+) Transcript_8205:1414-2565(+)
MSVAVPAPAPAPANNVLITDHILTGFAGEGHTHFSTPANANANANVNMLNVLPVLQHYLLTQGQGQNQIYGPPVPATATAHPSIPTPALLTPSASTYPSASATGGIPMFVSSPSPFSFVGSRAGAGADVVSPATATATTTFQPQQPLAAPVLSSQRFSSAGGVGSGGSLQNHLLSFLVQQEQDAVSGPQANPAPSVPPPPPPPSLPSSSASILAFLSSHAQPPPNPSHILRSSHRHASRDAPLYSHSHSHSHILNQQYNDDSVPVQSPLSVMSAYTTSFEETPSAMLLSPSIFDSITDPLLTHPQLISPSCSLIDSSSSSSSSCPNSSPKPDQSSHGTLSSSLTGCAGKASLPRQQAVAGEHILEDADVDGFLQDVLSGNYSL